MRMELGEGEQINRHGARGGEVALNRDRDSTRKKKKKKGGGGSNQTEEGGPPGTRMNGKTLSGGKTKLKKKTGFSPCTQRSEKVGRVRALQLRIRETGRWGGLKAESRKGRCLGKEGDLRCRIVGNKNRGDGTEGRGKGRKED